MAKTYDELLELVLEAADSQQKERYMESEAYQESGGDVAFSAAVIGILLAAAAIITRVIRTTKEIDDAKKRHDLQLKLVKAGNDMDATIRLAKKGSITKNEASKRLHATMATVEKLINEVDEVGEMVKTEMIEAIRAIVDDFDKHVK